MATKQIPDSEKTSEDWAALPRIEVLDYVTHEVIGIFQVASVPRFGEEIVFDSEDGESPDSVPYWYWVQEVRWVKRQPTGGDPILFPMVYVRKQPKGASWEAKEQAKEREV